MADDVDTELPEGEEEEAPKKSGGFMGIIIQAVVLGVVAFGTVYILPRPAPVIQNCEADLHHFAKEEKEPVPETPSIVEVSYVELDPLLVSLGKNLAGRHLRLGITLEASDGYDSNILKAQPKLRDAFTAYLRAVEVEQLEDPGMIPKLRSQLLRRAEVVLGQDVVYGVLITDFIVS